MAKNEAAEIRKYFQQKKAEADRMADLISQREKTVSALQRIVERIEIYMQFNDDDSSLVTVIYEPANSTHSSRVDVLPCQYTLKEIQKQIWL